MKRNFCCYLMLYDVNSIKVDPGSIRHNHDCSLGPRGLSSWSAVQICGLEIRPPKTNHSPNTQKDEWRDDTKTKVMNEYRRTVIKLLQNARQSLLNSNKKLCTTLTQRRFMSLLHSSNKSITTSNIDVVDRNHSSIRNSFSPPISFLTILKILLPVSKSESLIQFELSSVVTGIEYWKKPFAGRFDFFSTAWPTQIWVQRSLSWLIEEKSKKVYHL